MNSLKIDSLGVKNFKNFDEFSISLNPDKTILVGKNGVGKSGIGVDAVFFIFCGIAERGTELKGRKLYIKEGGAAEGWAIITDGTNKWRIERVVTETTSKVVVTCPDGSKLGQDFIDSFFDSALLNPLAFCRLDSREQCKVLGIDTSTYDDRIKELQGDYTILNRELKAFGEIELPEFVEPVDFSALSLEKDEILRFNQEQERLERDRNLTYERIAQLDSQIKQLRIQLENSEAAKRNQVDKLESLPMPEMPLSTESIDAQIAAASETNTKAQLYKEAVKKLQDKEAKSIEFRRNQNDQEEAKANKATYLQGLELPYANLTVDDNGGLLFDGRPIKERMFSRGQLIKIAVRLLGNKDREFKYTYLEDFLSLDEDNQVEIVQWLNSEGYQVVCEVVGKSFDGDSIVIEKK